MCDHFHCRFARHPISEAEVVANRGYTGPLFVKMNSSLRAASGKFPSSMTEHLKGNNYTNLIYASNSLLRKLSQISNIPKGRVVFRGLSGVKLPKCFEECDEGGARGGVDFGFLSTTTKKEVAVNYIGDKEMPVLFMFEVGDIDRGASLSFLSQYPNEEEILIPPLSHLEVVDEPFFMKTAKGDVKVYRARINCNLKSQTIEEIVAHRQKEVLAMLPYLDGALRRDVNLVAAALFADRVKEIEKKYERARADHSFCVGMHVLAAGNRAKKGVISTRQELYWSHSYFVRWDDGGECDTVLNYDENTQECSMMPQRSDIVLDDAVADTDLLREKEFAKTTLEEFPALIMREFDALWRGLAMPEQINWLNQDANYKQTMVDIIDYRQAALTRLVKAIESDGENGEYCYDDGEKIGCALHLACYQGRLKTVEALVAAGTPVDKREGGPGMTALMCASHRCRIGGCSKDRRNPEVVRLLLGCGAEVNAKCNYGNTALMFTHEKDETPSPEVLQIKALLRGYGATGEAGQIKRGTAEYV